MAKIIKAKLVIDYEDGLNFNTESSFNEALRAILSSIENNNNNLKIKIESEDGEETEFVVDEDVTGGNYRVATEDDFEVEEAFGDRFTFADTLALETVEETDEEEDESSSDEESGDEDESDN